MEAKTEEFLWLLFWTCDRLTHPTFRNLSGSFESWAYRNGFLKQVHRLEQRKFLERQSNSSGDRLHRLSEAARLHVLGGRDPKVCWNRTWDGRWRLVLFDVPEARSNTRDALRRSLQSRGFGYLQNSVWITPHPVSEHREALVGTTIDVESLIFLEARPCAGETDAEIVAGAWDFPEINARYERHGQILGQRPRRLSTKPDAAAFQRWIRLEREAWNDAARIDPFLPGALLPPNYAGRQAWRDRVRAMSQAGEQMRAFQTEP